MKISLGALCLSACACYFGYHSFAGNQGLSRWGEMQDEIETLEQNKQKLTRQRNRIAADIKRLSPAQLDLDFVEELARNRLNFAYPDELVMSDPQSSSAFSKS